jgi:hypothetical protein
MSEQDMEHPRGDDRNESIGDESVGDGELAGSPVPDPDDSDSDAEDVPTAD